MGSQLPVRVYTCLKLLPEPFPVLIESQNLVTKESEQTNSCVVFNSLGLNFYCLKKKNCPSHHATIRTTFFNRSRS